MCGQISTLASEPTVNMSENKQNAQLIDLNPITVDDFVATTHDTSGSSSDEELIERDGFLRKALCNNDKCKNYIKMCEKEIKEQQERFDKWTTDLESDLNSRCLKLKSDHDNLLTKCSSQQSSISNLEDIIKTKEAEIAALKAAIKKKENQKALKLIVSNDKSEMFKLKPTARSAKSVNIAEYKCEYQNCKEIGVDTIKCNGCDKWICDSCHDSQISKLKPAIGKCGSIAVYVLCKTCNEQVILNGISPKKITGDNNEANKLDKLFDTLHKSLNNSLQNMENNLESKINDIIDDQLSKKLASNRPFIDSMEDPTSVCDELSSEKNPPQSLYAKVTNLEKNMTELLDNKLKDLIPTEQSEIKSRTYASALQGTADMKKILQDARNDEKVEDREVEKRAPNFIIRNSEEFGHNDDKIRKNDEGYVHDLLLRLGVSSMPVNIIRLGKRNESERRPLKVVMPNKAVKIKIMSNLGKLKGSEREFGKISITDDYTASEREQIRKFSQLAKEKTETTEGKLFKVRGTPKNGLCVVEIPTTP